MNHEECVGRHPDDYGTDNVLNDEGSKAGLRALGGLLGGAAFAAATGPAVTGWVYETIGGTSYIRYLGAVGENAVGWIGERTAIAKAGQVFKPDGLTHATLNEVKNRAYVSMTRQLRAFEQFARETGREYVLWVRSNTTFSSTVEKLIEAGRITVRQIPGM
jgi:hypothetical protein